MWLNAAFKRLNSPDRRCPGGFNTAPLNLRHLDLASLGLQNGCRACIAWISADLETGIPAARHQDCPGTHQEGFNKDEQGGDVGVRVKRISKKKKKKIPEAGSLPAGVHQGHTNTFL